MKIMRAVKETGKKIEQAFTPTPQNQNDADILDTLKKEHEEVADLLKQLVDNESATTRKSLLKKIKAALVPHVRAEEKVVYNAIISQKGKQAQIDGEEGYLEHGLADNMLTALSKMANANSPEFTAGAKVLKEIIEHHVHEEERNVWHDVRKYYDGDARVAMNRKFQAEKKKIKVA